nr:MAG TPA: hypothetical protein [Caudoviricetes sp.]
MPHLPSALTARQKPTASTSGTSKSWGTGRRG